MIKKTGYICSLKYTPGLFKEFYLLGSNLQKNGWNVVYVIDKQYKWLIPDEILYNNNFYFITKFSLSLIDLIRDKIAISKFIKKQFSENRPDFVCIYNTHPLNRFFLKKSRKYKNIINSIYFHEPYKIDKSSFGKIGCIKVNIAEKLQASTLNYITDVIVPSAYAKKMYDLAYSKKYNHKVHIAPLMISSLKTDVKKERNYFSLVGTLNKSRNATDFIGVVKLFMQKKMYKKYNIKFCIITRSDISKELLLLPNNYEKYLDIINKEQISDEEINNILKKSFATLLPHKQVTQSGNVPVAFNCGTPIVCRNLEGLTQHVEHQKTGYILPKRFTEKDLLNAILYTKIHEYDMYKNCKNKFNSYFSENLWKNYYNWLIK